MRVGIDISQVAHEGTGVANYVTELVRNLASFDDKNEYILFYSSLRKPVQSSWFRVQSTNKNVTIKRYFFPPTLLDMLWNRLHIVPVEWFIGNVDVFISSDWVQPPTKAKAVTILYDLIVYTCPEETDAKIVATQKRRLEWVKKECDKIICISQSTKKDAIGLLGINENKLVVVYPGIRS